MKPVCISHNRDADGIVSAALIKAMTQCDVLLTDYEKMIQALESVDNARSLYICDLGLTKETEIPFCRQLERLRKTTTTYYIDHHPLGAKSIQTIMDLGVKTVHSTEECASVLIYHNYKEKLPKQAALLAACGAVTDDMESGTISKNIIQRYDRDLLLLEASILSYAIAERGEDEQFLSNLVDELSRSRFPHEIQHLCEYASTYAQRMLELSDRIAREGSKMKNLAHFNTMERSLGSVANFLIGEFDVAVGVAYRYKADGDRYIVSLRSSDRFVGNLGELTSKVSSTVGGLGGGHPNASGAVIPKAKLEMFLELFDKELKILHS
jgi:RecJ-like exonuclease